MAVRDLGHVWRTLPPSFAILFVKYLNFEFAMLFAKYLSDLPYRKYKRTGPNLGTISDLHRIVQKKKTQLTLICIQIDASALFLQIIHQQVSLC